MPNQHAGGKQLKTAYLTDAQEVVLNKVLAARDQTFADWMRAMIVHCAAERLPESQGDVKKVVPREVASIAQEALEQMGQFYLVLSGKQVAPQERRAYRKRAAPYLDAAAWCADVLEEQRRRLQVLQSGQRAPRHRVKDPLNPATATSSSTMDPPSG